MSTGEIVAWVAFYGDMSDFRVFRSEIACLRYAVANGMEAKPLRAGEGRMALLGCDENGRIIMRPPGATS